MSTRHASIPKKRKRRPLFDGSDGISYGRQTGITGFRITTPSVHPRDLVANPEAHRTKRPRFINVRHSQLPALEEQAKQDIAARKAGKHYLTCGTT